MIASLFGFLRIARNPIVMLEARLGLSPSPLERIFGIEGPFSGMTEASHRLVYLDLEGALSANPLVLILWTAASIMLVTWRFPKMKRRSDEIMAFAIAILATIVNNLA